jgi:hypothetical protein
VVGSDVPYVEKFANSVQFGQADDPRDIAAQKGAEKLVDHAAQCKFGTQVPGHTDAERDIFNDCSHSLYWKTIGGSTQMQFTNKADPESLETSEVW